MFGRIVARSPTLPVHPQLTLRFLSGIAAGFLVEVLILQLVIGWLVFFNIEDVKLLLLGLRNRQDQSDLVSRALKIRNSNCMDAFVKPDSTCFGGGCVSAVVIDDRFGIDVEFRAVVGLQGEAIRTGIRDPEPGIIVKGEPLEAVRNAGETLVKISGRQIQGRCVEGTDRLKLLEIRETRRIFFEQVYIALESPGGDHRDAEAINMLVSRKLGFLGQAQGSDKQ
jgi:hypothetical protein